VPPGAASALVVNVTATEPIGAGFLQALPSGTAPGQTSNVNYATNETAATQAIVPVGPDGTISVFTSNSAHIVVDLMGYMTSSTAPAVAAGRFVPVTPARYYDSRNPPNTIHTGLSTATIPLSGAQVPGGAAAVSINLTADQEQGAGFITVFPPGVEVPRSSNLNFVAQTPVANAALVKLGGGALDVFVNVATHVIIDVNGYFTGIQ
jgi:hypothetical protein